MKQVQTIFLCIALVLFATNSFAASSKTCFHHYAQLKKVQKKLKEGYTAKQGAELRRKQKLARDNWWDCKSGPRLKARKANSKSAKNTKN